jgi:hypothetical protein
MVLLVALSEHVLKAQDTGSFLSVTFGSALIQAKRSLDKFMQAQLKSLDDFKPKNAKKLGILPFIRNFEVSNPKYRRNCVKFAFTVKVQTDCPVKIKL